MSVVSCCGTLLYAFMFYQLSNTDQTYHRKRQDGGFGDGEIGGGDIGEGGGVKELYFFKA
jgi:hypothetical protein